MNISSVSFSGINPINNVKFNTSKNKSYNRCDVPETQKIQPSGTQTSSKSKRTAEIALALGGLAALVHQGIPGAVRVPSLSEPPAHFQTFSSINNIRFDDYIGRKIDDLKLKIDAMPEFSPEKLKQENLLFAYQLKREEQPKIADSFLSKDGYLTFKLHLKGNSVFEDNGKIGIEDFKKLFDIKDGALRDNNEFLKDRGRGTVLSTKLNKEKTPEHFFDYTKTKLKDGDTLKVPITAIDTENINLDGFYSNIFTEI